LALLYQKLLLTTVNPSKTSFLGIWALSTRESFREVANRFEFRSRSNRNIFSFSHIFYEKVC
jgi:hypothetical protein